MMNPGEHALTFDCAGAALQGVLACPARPAATGVLIVVGGPQYRAGSHRQFVLLARRLATAGYAALRFDVRGMGDSEGEAGGFEALSDDIAAAVDALQAACPSVRRIVLWGLCDAASAALLYWHARRDPRLAGLCLLNPWVRSETTLARAQVRHYYGQRFLQREFWRKLARGQVSLIGAARGLLGSLRRALVRAPQPAAPSFQTRMGQALADFPGPVLLLLSGRDLVAREFRECTDADPRWRAALARPTVQRSELPEADHTFSSAPWRAAVEEATLAWLARLAG